MPSSTNNSPTSCLSAGREDANKMKGNLCSVKAQRCGSTKGSGGCVTAAQRSTTTEQEDIPSLALSSLKLAVLFWHCAAVRLLRHFPWSQQGCAARVIPDLSAHHCPGVLNCPIFRQFRYHFQWNLLISKADTAAKTHQLWISWPPRPTLWHLWSCAFLPVHQHHKPGLPSCLNLAVAQQLWSNFKFSRHHFLSHPPATMLVWLVLTFYH